MVFARSLWQSATVDAVGRRISLWSGCRVLLLFCIIFHCRTDRYVSMCGSVFSSATSFALPRWQGAVVVVRRGVFGVGSSCTSWLVAASGRQLLAVISSQRGHLRIVLLPVCRRRGSCCLRRVLLLLLVVDGWRHGFFVRPLCLVDLVVSSSWLASSQSELTRRSL